MKFLRGLTIEKFREGLLSKKFTALEIAQGLFRHIKEKDSEIHAYLDLHEESALQEAENVDIALATGENLPPLAGVPLAIKDNILIKGRKTTSASKILETYVASYDATVIQKLKEEKAVFLGNANMDEFAMGASTENSAFQATKNPHDISRVPGGTSGGSAAAVAADMAVAALGSDTGGSIRQPSAFCGVVGLKPTYGAVSRSGLMPMASSLDQIGTITKTVKDAAILFNAIAGKDPMDATSAETAYGDDLLNPDFAKIKNLTIGLPEEYFVKELGGEIASAIEGVKEKLKELGMRFKTISLPHTKYSIPCYYIIVPAEISANLARFDGIRYSRIIKSEGLDLREVYVKQRGIGFGPEVKRRIILGTFVLSSGYYDAYYAKAQRVRSLIKNDFIEVFKNVDVLLTPATPHTAFKIGEKVDDPLWMYLEDIFTSTSNLAGLPAISIPAKSGIRDQGTGNSLPVGFQLIGRPFREADILGIGEYYEKSL